MGATGSIIVVALCILAVKLIAFATDSTPIFFLGDSIAFIQSALTDLLTPASRSYYYGRVIAYTSVSSGSLSSLLLAQLLAGTLSCLVLAKILTDHCGASKSLAYALSLLCAVEPLQLFMERNVMAESFSLMFFSIYVYFLIAFLKLGRARNLFFCALSGYAAVKFRTALTPLYFVGLALVVSFFTVSRWRELRQIKLVNPSINRFWRSSWAALFIMALLPILFGAGKLIDSRLGRGDIKGDTGYFLIAAWAPLLASNNIPFGPDWSQRVAPNCELDDLRARNRHRWWEGCLVTEIMEEYGSKSPGNAYAKKAAMYLLAHDPIGIATISTETYLDYWRVRKVKRALKRHRGLDRPLPESFRRTLATHFDYQAAARQRDDLMTGEYLSNSLTWYRMLVLSPLFMLLSLSIKILRKPIPMLLGAMSIAHLIFITSVSTLMSIRYLHPLAWMLILIAGVYFAALRSAFLAKLSHPSTRRS